MHVGSYRKRATADGEARRLGKELALPSRVVGVDLGTKGVWYRVVVGELGSRSEASALRDRLATKGIPDGVVLRLPESRAMRPYPLRTVPLLFLAFAAGPIPSRADGPAPTPRVAPDPRLAEARALVRGGKAADGRDPRGSRRVRSEGPRGAKGASRGGGAS